MKTSDLLLTAIPGCLLGMVAGLSVQAVELEPSYLERESHRIRFGAVSSMPASGDRFGAVAVAADTSDDFEAGTVAYKSPFKAFLLSAAVPGAGQWYTGSRLKPFIFLGTEIAAWGLHLKWHGDGEDATDEFEQFSRDHWSRTSYQDYLEWVYGERDDKLIPDQEISHHLPDTDTQQYFEMTGKYNQFAWGWDDATHNGSMMYRDYNQANPPPAITGESTTPYSARRFQYESLRFDANEKYDRARKMIMVSILNRLVSSFEAYFAAKRHNQSANREDSTFGRLSVRASLKSYHAKQDTPFVRVSYKF